jgi:hypothetical protein
MSCHVTLLAREEPNGRFAQIMDFPFFSLFLAPASGLGTGGKRFTLKICRVIYGSR